ASCSKRGSAETKSLSQDESPAVAVERVTRTSLSRSLTLTAEFTPFQEVDVMSKVAGFVKAINVDIGDRVRTGQILATLEVPEMNDDLARAAATVQRSDAEIQRARDEVERAKAAHEIAHLSYQRLQGVAQQKPGLIAQQEIDDAKSKDLSSEAQLSASRSNLLAAEQQTAVNRAEQSRYKTLYNYTKVTAPFEGVVTMRYANTGSMIQAGISSQTQAMPVVRLSQNNLLRLLLPVPESAVSHIRLGQEVKVRVSSLNRSFTGKVARFSDKVATATRTMETEVDVPNPSLVIVPGMYAEVDLQLEYRPDVLSIPVAAADLTSGEPRVYKVAADQTIEILPVKLGLETSSRVEVLSGLGENDEVVVGPRAALKGGDKVKPQVVAMTQPKAES
ncbi:MAG: efflux RND transporter periplasmic adaptor subunit, partial [Bryobacteraceae bacterium]